MRILLINSFYNQGSTGKIVEGLGRALRGMGHDAYTCYGYGNDHYDEYSTKICSKYEHLFNALLNRITGIQYGGLYLSNYRIIQRVKEFKPDIIHIHCINGYMVNVYSLFDSIAKLNIKTVITLHAEIYHTAGCSHAFQCEKWKTKCHECSVYKQAVTSLFFDRSATAWEKMYNSIQQFKRENLLVTGVSPWLVERAKDSSILKDCRIEYVPNGLDTAVFNRKSLKQGILGSDYSHKVVFVTPIFSESPYDQKGGRFLSAIAKENPDTLFVVVSSKTSKNLSALPKNIRLWGNARNQIELASLYCDADLSLILSRRETFSMVTAESLCCGTPVVGFKAGGPETISLREYSTFVDYGDLFSLNETIKKYLEKSFDKDLISKTAIEKYSNENVANVYSYYYESMMR